MALTISEKTTHVTGASGATSGSFTPLASSLLFVCVYSEAPSASPITISDTLAEGGLVWNTVAAAGESGGCTMLAWTYAPEHPRSGHVAVATGYGCSMQVFEVDGFKVNSERQAVIDHQGQPGNEFDLGNGPFIAYCAANTSGGSGAITHPSECTQEFSRVGFSQFSECLAWRTAPIAGSTGLRFPESGSVSTPSVVGIRLEVSSGAELNALPPPFVIG